MSLNADAIYNLLPTIYRVRDSELGIQRAESVGLSAGDGERFRPLRQLIEVIAGQAEVLDEELAQLYDNHFVETAAPWALPYLADLLGLRGLSGSEKRTLAPRAEVGHTIGYRRRKGTASVLEQLARDVTGQPARVVEFFERLAMTQQLNHLRPGNRAIMSLRNAARLEFFGTPFDDSNRTVEIRRIQPRRGHWNIPNVGLFLWRLRAFSLSRTPLAAAHLADGRHFRFHPLGLDTALFNLPVTEDDMTHLAEPLNVPLPITCRMLNGAPASFDQFQFHPSPEFYGPERSLQIEAWDKTAGTYAAVTADRIIVCDLEDIRDPVTAEIVAWGHEDAATAHKVILLDPRRGRVLFDTPQPYAQLPLGSFHYGFSGNVGGGEYARAGGASQVEGKVVRVSAQAAASVDIHTSIADALAELGNEPGTILIEDSSRYEETLPAIEASGRQVEIRAADGARPTVNLRKELKLSGDREGSVILDGLLLAGKGIRVEGTGSSLGHLIIRHCTLMPKLVTSPEGKPAAGAAAPSITSAAVTLDLEIANSIIRPLRLAPRSTIYLHNCIVDGGATDGMALSSSDGEEPAAGTWRIENSTIIGKCRLRVLELASNSIFLGSGMEPLIVQQRQTGCVRFSWVPPRARVPRRHQCLPGDHGPKVRPVFTSLRWGDATYAQLHWLCPQSVRRGADDESEMGVFHDGHAPQREAYLRGRLEEYLRFGLETGVFPLNPDDRLDFDFSVGDATNS